MSGYRSVNYYDLCRLCTTSSGSKIHIFSAEGKKKNLYQKISECLPIVVDEKDKLPKILCGNCLQQVENIVEFRNTCINSQTMLEGCLNSTLQNGGKVYIKDATPKFTTISTNIIKEASPQNAAAITAHGSDFLSTIIQAVGIQQNDDITNTTETRTNIIPQYTVTLDGKAVKTGQVEYKVEDTTNTLSAQQAEKQAKHNSLAEFLKMKPNIKVTPISKKKENPQQQQQTAQVQAPITITSSEAPKVKKPKYNIVITSPNQQKQTTPIIQTTAVAPAQQQHQQHQNAKTVSLQDVKFLSSNKCFLPITIKDCNTDQQIVATIDTKNLVLPTTYSLQMKLQPQIATVDGQPIVHLTPTSIPATLSLAPSQTISTTQNYQQDQNNQNQILTAGGIDASTSTNEQEIIFTTTTNALQSHHQTGGITIQQVPQQITTATSTAMPKLQITTIPTSVATTQMQTQKSQQNTSAITVQRITPQSMKIKMENSAVAKVLTQQQVKPQIQQQQQQQQQQTVQQQQQQIKTVPTSIANTVVKCENLPLLECSTCGRGFKKKEHLAQHMKLHAGLRPFKCTEPGCDKAFSRKEHLMRHIVSHTGKKMFSCDLCQKLFSRKDNLNKHKRTHTESGNAQFVCEICNKSFVVKMYYIQHKLMHEKNGQITASKIKAEKNDDGAENITVSSDQITNQINQQTQQQQQQSQQQQQPQIMQLQISSPVVTSSDGTSTISISQAPDHQQQTTTTVLKTLGTHDTAVLNLPQSLANLVSINSAQFMTTDGLMGHIKLENNSGFGSGALRANTTTTPRSA